MSKNYKILCCLQQVIHLHYPSEYSKIESNEKLKFRQHIYIERFIMYSGITDIYYRKTVGHVFTKPVQIEGTTQKKKTFPSKFTFLPLSDASVCGEKMAAPEEKSFCVLEYHTSNSVVTVQSAFLAK